jgi:hypothetical protein
MPSVAFEPTYPVLERSKTVHALDRAATVIVHHGTIHPQYVHIHRSINVNILTAAILWYYVTSQYSI